MVDLDLTKRQKEIFDFIRKYAAKTGYPPTVREIGKAVGLHSSSTVHAHLANLEKIGLLHRDPSKPRAIELLFDKAKRTIRPGQRPAAGRPGRRRRADPGRGEHRGVPRDPRRDRRRGRRLHPPDPRRKHEERRHPRRRLRDRAAQPRTPIDGEIVVALIGEEATVKRFFREKDHIRLQPENEEMEPILTTEAEVLGRVVGVFRKV